MIELGTLECSAVEVDVPVRSEPHVVEHRKRRGKRSEAIDDGEFRLGTRKLG